MYKGSLPFTLPGRELESTFLKVYFFFRIWLGWLIVCLLEGYWKTFGGSLEDRWKGNDLEEAA